MLNINYHTQNLSQTKNPIRTIINFKTIYFRFNLKISYNLFNKQNIHLTRLYHIMQNYYFYIHIFYNLLNCLYINILKYMSDLILYFLMILINYFLSHLLFIFDNRKNHRLFLFLLLLSFDLFENLEYYSQYSYSGFFDKILDF